MEDIRKQDARLFFLEACSFGRLLVYAIWIVLLIRNAIDPVIFKGFITLPTAAVIACLGTAYTASVKKRFRNKRMETLWNGCQDRLARFEEVLGKLRKDKIADLREMPNTIRSVSRGLYAALRRADIITDEVAATESGMLAQPPAWQVSTKDAQSKELYRIADRNIAEYRSQFASVLAGVERTEAQSAVFITTLDTLRMKLIGYRLVGRSPEMGSQDFLEAIAEAKMQLQAIDTALEELDLGHYPKTISVIPPKMPEEAIRLQDKL